METIIETKFEVTLFNNKNLTEQEIVEIMRVFRTKLNTYCEGQPKVLDENVIGIAYKK